LYSSAEELYDFLKKSPTEWEEVRSDEGVRWIRFIVEEDHEDE